MNNITLSNLSKDWLGLTDDYRPSAFWFWNAAMEPESIEKNITEMHRQGIREFLIHPIHGLDIEYLSDVYFERYRYALSVARKYGLRVWIYDEYGWPSGNAGGKLLEQYPEHKAWYLRFSKDSNGTIIVEPFLSDRLLDNVVGANWTKGTCGSLDTLSKEAVQCFIQMTHERYYRECRDFFKDVITGFFTDEPVTMVGCAENQREIWNTIGLPWTPELPKLFNQKFGYDIEKRYIELASQDASKIKDDYWNIVKNLHIEAYHNQISKWCKDHNVKYTGHIGEDFPLTQIRFSGSPFLSLGAMDEPGVDMLFSEPCPEHRFLQQVLVSSVARHSGRQRVFCEAFGISPFSIRLGQLLRSSQMLGIHGVNDIAMMGFHESLDGVRKRMYWPPLFKTSPWWPFYPEFCDACARSVGLTSLGKSKARYAVLYPQYQLEQDNVFMDGWSNDEPAMKNLNRIGAAIYEAGETFEFIFPENLHCACVKDGMITLGQVQYSEILVTNDLLYSQENIAAIEGLMQQGAKIEYAPTDHIVSSVKSKSPLWNKSVDIRCQSFGKVRVFEYSYSDGSLFALRNVFTEKQEVCIHSNQFLTEWDPISGNCIYHQGDLYFVIEPNSTKYFSVSSLAFGEKCSAPYDEIAPIDSAWTISTDMPNMARLLNIQFFHGEYGWLSPEYYEGQTNIGAAFIPSVFKGQTQIKMRGEFNIDSIPAKLGVVYEQNHFADLIINGQVVPFGNAHPLACWDSSCQYIEVSSLCHEGLNTIEGQLLFEKFETSLCSDGYFRERPVMPTCDVCIAGSFKSVNGKLVNHSDEKFNSPLNLSEIGWVHYSGRVIFTSIINVDQSLSEKIRGLQVSLVSEDAIEVILDGNSLGCRIVEPYKFELDSVTAGQHKLELVMSTTSGNILDEPSPSGLLKVEWLC